MNIQKRNNEDVLKAYETLDEEDKVSLVMIKSKLNEYTKESGGVGCEIDDSQLMKKIAKVCLSLIDKTPKDQLAIMDVAFIISDQFVYFNYTDQDLQEIIDLADELQLPQEQLSEDVFILWDKLKKSCKRYLDK